MEKQNVGIASRIGVVYRVNKIDVVKEPGQGIPFRYGLRNWTVETLPSNKLYLEDISTAEGLDQGK
jgi:hypothetical protein